MTKARRRLASGRASRKPPLVTGEKDSGERSAPPAPSALPSPESAGSSEDVRAELEATRRALAEAQAKLLRSEKLASLGMLVAGIAHEINTPIGAVRSMHETLVRAVSKLRDALAKELPDYESRPKLAAMLAIIEDSNRVVADGSQRVIEIVRRVRSFARLEQSELQEIPVESRIEDTLTLIHHELKHRIKVHRDYLPVPPIACYPGRLDQVFLNLLMNARQAIPGDGEIFVRTFTEGGWACVAIRDTGVGIPEDNLQHIFEPGFTTKGAGMGTGLGLSIVQSIVDEHRGKIEVESVVGKGTTFTVRIPLDLRARLAETGPEEEPGASQATEPVSPATEHRMGDEAPDKPLDRD